MKRLKPIHPVRFLLIDDNPNLVETTAEFVRSAGPDVLIAETGTEALKAAAEFEPDVVLCDMRLPDMSGLQFAHGFRAIPCTRPVLVAIFTARSDADIRALERETSQNHVNLFLSKPLTQEKLNKLLNAFAALRTRTS